MSERPCKQTYGGPQSTCSVDRECAGHACQKAHRQARVPRVSLSSWCICRRDDDSLQRGKEQNASEWTTRSMQGGQRMWACLEAGGASVGVVVVDGNHQKSQPKG